MNKRIGLLLSCLMTLIVSLRAQTEGIDTTSQEYKIGYQIGEWLPFLVIFTLALMVIIRSYRLSQKKDIK
jgi:lipopolysaccharide export LptBFGC system permease protein LptF